MVLLIGTVSQRIKCLLVQIYKKHHTTISIISIGMYFFFFFPARTFFHMMVHKNKTNTFFSQHRKYWILYSKEYLKFKTFDRPVIFLCCPYLRSLYTRHSRLSWLSWVPCFSRLTLLKKKKKTVSYISKT